MRYLTPPSPGPAGLWISFLIGAALAGCGDSGTNADAGGDQDAAAADAVRLDATNPDATTTDARPDAGPVDTGPQHDSGPIDGGPCGCSYGYHHECGQGQTCQVGFGPPLPQQPLTMCVSTGTISSGVGGACTSTTGHTPGSCNAQCVAEAVGSPCLGEPNISGMAQILGYWHEAMANASLITSTPWNPMSTSDVEHARTAWVSSACTEYLGWTVLGLLELCRGEGTVTHPSEWSRIEFREFRTLDRNSCNFRASGLCVGTLMGILDTRDPNATALLNEFQTACPEGLPFAQPCRGTDALDCIRSHIQMIARTLM